MKIFLKMKNSYFPYLITKFLYKILKEKEKNTSKHSKLFVIHQSAGEWKVIFFHRRIINFMHKSCKKKMCVHWSMNVKEREGKTGSQVLPTFHIKSSFIILKTSIKFHIVSSQFNLLLYVCNFRDVSYKYFMGR